MKTFYPQNQTTYLWGLLAKWLYYAFVLQLGCTAILFIVGKSSHLQPTLFEVSLFLIGSFLELDMVSGTHVKSIAIDDAHMQIIIQYKRLIFIHKEKKISFDDFQYAFNGCSQKSIGNRIVRMFIPSFQSDLRILGPKQRKIFFRDTFGWTNQQVAEVADAFRQIKPPMNFVEFAPW